MNKHQQNFPAWKTGSALAGGTGRVADQACGDGGHLAGSRARAEEAAAMAADKHHQKTSGIESEHRDQHRNNAARARIFCARAALRACLALLHNARARYHAHHGALRRAGARCRVRLSAASARLQQRLSRHHIRSRAPAAPLAPRSFARRHALRGITAAPRAPRGSVQRKTVHGSLRVSRYRAAPRCACAVCASHFAPSHLVSPFLLACASRIAALLPRVGMRA